MAERIPAAATIRVPLQAYLASDHVTPATGVTIAITISKNGAAYGNPSGGATNATEIGVGSYYVDLSTTDTGTTGPLFIKGTSATIDNIITIYDVVNANNGGLAALPDTAVSTNGSLLTSGTGTAQLAVSGGVANADMVKISTDSTAADNAESFFDGTGYAGTNNVIPLVTTVTNLTNAATAGDLTATMKTSVTTAATAATPTAAAVTAAVAITSNVKKNQALTAFTFLMTDSTNHQAATGLAVTGTVTINGAAPVALTNAVTEISNGWYKVNLAAADTNGNVLGFLFTAAGADDRFITEITQP